MKWMRLIFILAISIAITSFAEAENSLDLQAGFGAPTNSFGDGFLEFGAAYEKKLTTDVGVGAYLGFQFEDRTANRQFPYGILVNWHFGDAPYYLGANIGMITALSDLTVTALTLGGQLGANFAINQQWSLGAEVRFFRYFTDYWGDPLQMHVVGKYSW
jgi:hypothetical protein